MLVSLSACSPPGGDEHVDAALPELKITVFAPPSQSIWLPILVKHLKLDEKQGFRLTVTPKPGQVAYTDFASGADPVCYCAAPAAVARFVQHGADITLLWNVFDLDFFVVTNNPAIRTVGDLAGKHVSADTGTGSWAVSAWLLQQNGIDLDALRIQSTSTSAAMMAELAVGRVDALVVGLIEMATLATSDQDGGYRIMNLNSAAIWSRYESSPGIPSITLGVWRSWLAAPGHVDLLKKFYRANVEAAAYLRAHPQEAAQAISAQTTMSEKALLYLFEHDPQIIDIRPISEYKGAIKLLTQQLLPQARQLDRPLTDAELDAYVSDFQP